MDKINIELTHKDAKALLLLGDSMNFYAIGAALSRGDNFSEDQIYAVSCALGHICMNIDKAMKNTTDSTQKNIED